MLLDFSFTKIKVICFFYTGSVHFGVLQNQGQTLGGRLVYWSALGLLLCLCLVSQCDFHLDFQWMSMSLAFRRYFKSLTSSAPARCTWQRCEASVSGCCTTRTPRAEIFLSSNNSLCETGNHTFYNTSFGIKFSYLNVVDDMLLLGVSPIEVVGADNVDGWSWGASLHYVHDVVCVWYVEPAYRNTDTFDPTWSIALYWLGGVLGFKRCKSWQK